VPRSLTTWKWEIDVNKSVLYLYRLNKSGERISTTAGSVAIKPNIQVPIEVINSVIFVSAHVGESKLRYCLDTGAEINVLSNEVPKKSIPAFPTYEQECFNRYEQSESGSFWRGELDELTIGTYTFGKFTDSFLRAWPDCNPFIVRSWMASWGIIFWPKDVW
jgi:hypothetical protein